MIEWGKRGRPDEIAARIAEVYHLLVTESGDPMPEIRMPGVSAAGEPGTINGWDAAPIDGHGQPYISAALNVVRSENWWIADTD